ncbi:MAG: aminotransferase class V-fold PLP-dependent enzyme [Lachnospiraceae bacterium]|nr:aminotransferase class V-fold PLP-dependent enzyme [Lachnospiraceae bacterium]
MIYLDNAATTITKPPQVGEAVLAAMGTMGNNARGTHGEALTAARTVYQARKKLASFFNCSRPDHVVFTANVTEAINLALFGLLRPGDHAVTTVLEHNSVLRPLYMLEEERGIRLDIAPADEAGDPDYETLEELAGDDAKLIICTHASNLTGNVVDIRRVSRIAHSAGALLAVDAAQTAGTRRIDMEELGIDILLFTGHKGLLGPQGTGGMCIREGVEIRPVKSGGTGIRSYSRKQPEELPARLEAGTLNGHGIAGLLAALDYITETGVDEIEAREKALTARFLNGIRDIPGIRVYGKMNGDHAAIVALNIGERDSGEIADILSEEYGIAVRAGAHCAPLMHQSLGTVKQGAVRFSFSWFTKEEEVDAAVSALREIAANL